MTEQRVLSVSLDDVIKFYIAADPEIASASEYFVDQVKGKVVVVYTPIVKTEPEYPMIVRAVCAVAVDLAILDDADKNSAYVVQAIRHLSGLYSATALTKLDTELASMSSNEFELLTIGNRRDVQGVPCTKNAEELMEAIYFHFTATHRWS